MASANLGRVKPIYRGGYDASFTYQALDFVRFGSTLYIAKRESKGNEPTNETYFDRVTESGSAVPEPNRVVKSREDGTIDLKWLGDIAAAMLMSGGAKVNHIGVPGTLGYGVGVCPEIPEGYAALAGTYTLGSDDYGNYRYSDGSIMVWVPTYYYRVGHPDNPTYAEYRENSIHTEPFSAFSSRAEAAAEGYALHRGFIDGGEVMPGFMHDKYRCSNNDGTASSIKGGKPLTASSAHNPFSELDGSPLNNLSGAIDAAKTRGEQFFPNSRFMRSALAILGSAHAQATTSVSHNAWWDPTNVTNFVKGNNNNALGDTNDPEVSYESDGYSNCGKTGSGQPFAKTTHNGQNCGIADLNGNVYTIELGLTCVAEIKSITNASSSNPVALTVVGHGIAQGQQVQIGGVNGMTQINDKIFTASVVDADTITLDGVDGSELSNYIDSGTVTFGTFYAAKESAKMSEFTGGNSTETDHWGPTGVAANMEPIELNFATNYPNNGFTQRFGNESNAVIGSESNGNEWMISGLGLPLANGISTSGSSLFGNDRHSQYIRNELCVLSGANWLNGSFAGPWSVILNLYRTYTGASSGFSSASFPVGPSGSERQ